MKKFFLFAAAMFAAFTINAGEINIDLSKNVAFDANASLANGELTVSYNLEAWGAGGVKFALDNLDVTNLAFDYKGDAAVADWVSLIVYLEDSEGGKWYSNAADLSISNWNAEWESKSFMPSDVLWGSSTAATPVKPFVSLGFMANPANPTAATFAIRNVVLTVEGETAIGNTAAEVKSSKIVRNGQILIVRDGRTFNALGAEVK